MTSFQTHRHRPRRPIRYRLRVTAPEFDAWVLIEAGFCVAADPSVAPWLGCSAPWIYGRIRYEGWHAAMLPAPAPEPPQGDLL